MALKKDLEEKQKYLAAEKTVYDFNVVTNDNVNMSLKWYKNKVLLVVNMARNSKYSNQGKILQRMYQKYKDRDFVVLGFPSNQFGSEPGSNPDIK